MRIIISKINLIFIIDEQKGKRINIGDDTTINEITVKLIQIIQSMPKLMLPTMGRFIFQGSPSDKFKNAKKKGEGFHFK